jgi:hypothetical protein
MTRILTALVASVFALLTAACCCTGEAKPPGLRAMPKFQEIEAAPAQAPAPEVDFSSSK